MNYANINSVYSTVKDILNKQQLGFITPSQFNVFAPQAERELTDEILELIHQYVKSKLRYADDENSSIIKGLRDDVSTLFVYNELQSASSGTNVFNYPDRYYYLESISYQGKTVDDIKPSNAPFVINNYFTPPSLEAPVAVFASNQITVYPTNLFDDIAISYYKNPMGSRNGQPLNQAPSWQYTQVGEDLLYNASTSVDFELPKSVETKLVYKILSLAGFSIREPEAVQFANVQEKKDKSTEI